MNRRKRKLDSAQQAETFLPISHEDNEPLFYPMGLGLPRFNPTELSPEKLRPKPGKPARRAVLREKAQREIEAKWSPYKFMWTLVMFDLPTETKEHRRDYTRFRNNLLKMGLSRMQFSIYYRCVPTDEKSKALGKAIKKILPPYGEVRILCVTARQFEMMEVFLGKKPRNPEKEPQQLMFF